MPVRTRIPGLGVVQFPTEEARDEALRELDELWTANPLHRFHPHSDPQREFMGAGTPIQAAFAGNRFGKTTSLTIKSLVQLCDRDAVPEHLQPFKVFDPPCFGRIVCPSFGVLDGVLLQAFRKWAPKGQLLQNSFDKAYQGPPARKLRFRNGSWVEFMTYEQDLDKFGGSALHFVGYDEPPSQPIRNECLARLVDYGGFEMFAMTPLMGIGWIYREVYKQSEAPHITVIRGSIHDNPTLDAQQKELFLRGLSEEERRSREHGDFAHFGGMIYPDGFEKVLVQPLTPEQLQGKDVVVGIDPGMRNAAFVWVAFDNDNRAVAFHDELLQDKTPADYARLIRAVNKRWKLRDPLYVIDPSARNRSLTNAESVESELQRQNIFPMHGQNSVEAGIQNIRRRIQQKAFYCSRDCRALRDEALEYRSQRREDGEFAVVKENDHRLDALRYAVMTRAWHPGMLQEEAQRQMGYRPGHAPPMSSFIRSRKPSPAHPLGDMA